jgi:hypothetical protein
LLGAVVTSATSGAFNNHYARAWPRFLRSASKGLEAKFGRWNSRRHATLIVRMVGGDWSMLRLDAITLLHLADCGGDLLPARRRRAVMRCIMVNGAKLKTDACCHYCRKAIAEHYVREIGNRQIYCDHDCYCYAIGMMGPALPTRARPPFYWRISS